jgi:hypothetical protein
MCVIALRPEGALQTLSPKLAEHSLVLVRVWRCELQRRSSLSRATCQSFLFCTSLLGTPRDLIRITLKWDLQF